MIDLMKMNKSLPLKCAQAGLSLVEVLVALALGSFLMTGLVQVFLANQQTSMLQEDFARVQESGRIGMEMLVKDVRMADFRGCMHEIEDVTDHLDTGDTDYDANTMDFLAGGIDGANDVTAVTIGGQAVKNNTDTLTIRGSADACAGLGRMNVAVPKNAAQFTKTAGCSISAGEVIILSNCVMGDMFTVTQQNPVANTVDHSAGPNPTPGWIDNASQGFSTNYGLDAQILRPYQKTYFIAPGTNGNSLWLNDSGASLELVTGVTDFQVQYGEDTDDDDSVDLYVDSDTVTDMEEVKSILLTLAIADGSVAKSYTTVANIRNRQ